MSEDKIAAAARLLSEARTPGQALETFPTDLAPDDEAEALAMHERVVTARGPVVAWKVGAPTPAAEPGYGMIADATFSVGPTRIPAGALRLWAVEAEIAVTLGQDLPDRAEPYAQDEVLAAVKDWRAAIEVLDTAFVNWASTPGLWRLADGMSHGALIVGPPCGLPSGALATLPVTLEIGGETIFAHEGGNTGGDPARLLTALANLRRGTARPLRAGDVVTTGSATPFHRASGGQAVRAYFDGLEAAELTIEP
ncbi:2-keto-4-pentenoate hydratase [Hansschlegelia quercus]|nr:fumarylacetoacetate hydrolase family protein [Hansschlegelia quercus]